MTSKIDFVIMAFVLFAMAGPVMNRGASATSFEAPGETPWLAGVARVEITPEEPLWLAGYAARNRPAEETLHPLWAKALVLRDAEGTTAALITADILGFPKALSDRIRDKVEEEYGLPRAQVILSASHTHSGPVIGDSLRCMYTFDEAEAAKIQAYTEIFEARILKLVGEALDGCAPAALRAGNGVARIAVNRRNNSERDLTPESAIAGPSDHAVPTLAVIRADGRLDAVLFGYACHATVLDGYAWNGDYPGFAQIALEETHPGATALFFAGCGADQNALPRRSVALARQYGHTLAAAVNGVLEGDTRALEARFAAAYTEIPLELEAGPDRDTLRDRAENTSGYEQRCNQWLLNQLEQGGVLPGTYPYPVQLWRLGDQKLVVLGGEVTVPYALGVKERLGGAAFVMGYANDLMAYIPSERILEEGGYEGVGAQLIYGLPNRWKAGIEARILEAASALDQQLSE